MDNEVLAYQLGNGQPATVDPIDIDQKSIDLALRASILVIHTAGDYARAGEILILLQRMGGHIKSIYDPTHKETIDKRDRALAPFRHALSNIGKEILRWKGNKCSQ